MSGQLNPWLRELLNPPHAKHTGNKPRYIAPLGLVMEDQKLSLQAMMSTYSTGLSGVMFVLWRYLRMERCVLEP
jgi:hypothetical protein